MPKAQPKKSGVITLLKIAHDIRDNAVTRKSDYAAIKDAQLQQYQANQLREAQKLWKVSSIPTEDDDAATFRYKMNKATQDMFVIWYDGTPSGFKYITRTGNDVRERLCVGSCN
jgi:hypothetical protein